MRRSSLFLVLGLLVILVHCGKDSPSEPDPNDVIIPDTTKPVQSDDFATHLVSISGDGATFVFTQGSSSIDNLRSGDVMVSDNGQGYLRKVTSVSSAGGQVTVRTTQAALTDAIEQGAAELTRSISASDTVATLFIAPGVSLSPAHPEAGGFFVRLDSVVIYDRDQSPSTTNDQIKLNGSLQINPQLVFKIKIRNWKLEELTVSNGITEQASLGVSAGIVSLEGRKEKELYRANMKPITFWVGPVPVVITPIVTVTAGVEGSVHVTLESSITQDASFTAGLRYESQQWSPIMEMSHQFGFSPPSVTANAQAKAFIGPDLSFLLYGVVGPEVTAALYGELVADLMADPWLTLWAGIEAGVGVKMEVMSHVIAGYEKPDVIDLRVKLWESPPSPAPDIEVTASLQMTAQTNTSTTATMTVRNTGNATLNVTSITDNATWLTVSPTNFSVSAGSSRDVTVTANASGLSAGTYTATISIASNDPDENPKTVPVTFTVTSAATPDIDVTPSSLSMSAQTGSSTTATLSVRNTGNATLSVTSITDNQNNPNWLTESPTNFTVSAGSSQAVTVTANAAGLSAGTYSGTITIASNDPDEATMTIGVTFTVTGGGTAQIDMIRINGGTFQMGSTSQWADSDEQPVHQVNVSAFYMSKYEVTQAQYEAVMGSDPSYFSGDNRPVERVSWHDAARFCNALSVSEGRTPCYNESDWSCNLSANGYRLPTEAEWEYACRAGTTTDFYSGNETSSGQDPNMDLIGWYYYNSNSQTHDVGGKQANSFGLYDMSGNVWEWCNDWYGSYSSGSQTDPTGPSSGSYRVIRGGGWGSYALICRSAYRFSFYLGGTDCYLGIRLARR